MTDQQGPTRRDSPLGWVDGLGLAAIASVTAGAAVVWGLGWALITFGAILGSVYILLEVVFVPRPAKPDRRP